MRKLIDQVKYFGKTIIKEEFGHNSNYSIEQPVRVKFILYKKGDAVPVKLQAVALKNVDEFKLKMKKFKQSFPPEYEKDIEETNGIHYFIKIKLVNEQIGSISKDQEDFLDFIAFSTGEQYELFY